MVKYRNASAISLSLINRNDFSRAASFHLEFGESVIQNMQEGQDKCLGFP